MGKNPNNHHTRPVRVLVLTPFYAPDFGPSAPIFTALCEDLQHNGCQVTVVAGIPHYGNARKLYPYPRRLFAREVINGVRILRIFVFDVPKSSLSRRLLYHAFFNLFSTIAALFAGRSDVILADAPSLWSGLPLLTQAIIPGKPYIYIIHDIYPEVLVKLQVLHNQRMIKFIDQIEGFFYRHASQISVLSDGFKKNLLEKGVPERKIAVIPVCVDADFVQPMDCDPGLCQEWDLESKYVVLYAGNMGLSQGLENVVEAARQLTRFPDIALVLVGEGASKPGLQKLVSQYGLANIHFYPFQPREKVPQIYSLAHVCLVSLNPSIVTESVPSKTFTIMAACRPIIATVDPNTEVGRLLDVAGCGLRVDPEKPNSLAEAVIRLYHDRDLGEKMGKLGRNFVVSHFSRGVASEYYHHLILQCTDGR